MADPFDADPFDLERFVQAQLLTYDHALAELRAGTKTGHWMWFIFPQIAGLGLSAMSRHYAIGSRAEGEAYLVHPVLGPRLGACTEATLAHPDAIAIFGAVDAMKFQSCLTLFDAVAGDGPFCVALDHFYAGSRDPRTLELLAGG